MKKLKYEKAQFTNNGVIQLYIAREGSGGKLPDPGILQKGPDPTGSATLLTRTYLSV